MLFRKPEPQLTTVPFSDLPPLPTAKRTRLSGGRVISGDPGGGMWLYRSLPSEPMVDAKEEDDIYSAASTLMRCFNELAAMSRTINGKRGLSRSTYREIHLLWVNVPVYFDPGNHPNRRWLRSELGDQVVWRRVLLLGVRLRDSINTGSVTDTVSLLREQWTGRTTPVVAFNRDYELVSAALSRDQLREPTDEEFRLADAWWNHGKNADTPALPHTDHLHFFTEAHSMRIANDVGREFCDEWEENGVSSTAVTFASVHDFDLDFEDPASETIMWATALGRQQAACISVRGWIEPPEVTKKLLRVKRRKNMADIRERADKNNMERIEQEDHLELLEQVENMYARGEGTPTLVDTSVVVGLSGVVEDLTAINANDRLPVLELTPMANMQLNAWRETLISSSTRANPNLHDLPSQTIAHAGLQSLATVGDPADQRTALAGFTEMDRQPAWLSATEASDGDEYPITLCAGGTGSGKSVFMQWQAAQFAMQGVPVVVIDPKTKSDLEPVVNYVGGQTASLDDLLSADGIWDPIRFFDTPAAGVSTAVSVLSQINLWGTRVADYEGPLQVALAHGVRKGATCTGQALKIALDDGVVGPDLVDPVLDYANADEMLRSIVGINPTTEGLRITSKLTLIKVGEQALDLPPMGASPYALETPLKKRITVALVRMMVQGSSTALMGRGGVVMLDEAWMFLSAGKEEVEKLGRLARQQNVLPMLFTQRVTDAVRAGLAGFISRGFVLPLEKEEARAACELFELDPARWVRRLAANKHLTGHQGLNWWSMHALVEGEGEEKAVLRGTVAIYCDLKRRAVPIEVRLPEEFLELAKTTPDAVRRRDEARRRLVAQQAGDGAEQGLDVFEPSPVGASPAAETGGGVGEGDVADLFG